MSPTISPAALPNTVAPPVAPKDAAASTTQPGNVAPPALDWLMAWVTENAASMETPEQVPAAGGNGQTTAPKVHWLTLLAGANTFTADSSANLAIQEGTPATVLGDEVDSKRVSSAPVSLHDTQAEADGDEEPDPGTEIEDAAGTAALLDPTGTVPMVGLGPAGAPKVPEAVAATPANGDVDSRRSAPGFVPLPQSILNAPQVDPLTHPAVTPKDKGEVIWTADFTVQDKTDPATSATARVPGRDRAAVSLEPANERNLLAVKASDSSSERSSSERSAQQEMASQDAEPDTKEPATKTEHPEMSKSRSAQSALGETRSEPQSAAPDRIEARALEGGARGTSFVSEVAPRESSAPRSMTLAATEHVSAEAAAPLRPTQIATVQVDVPAPAGSEDLAQLRLIVSQRGDQVSVRLRSWDVGTPAIESDRMQPLLHSLAEKGFVQELKPGMRPDELLPLAVERTQERQPVPAETTRNGNDSQPFRDGSDRQQQNQERQQQQQAFFLRKQMKMAHSMEFEITPSADTSHGQSL